MDAVENYFFYIYIDENDVTGQSGYEANKKLELGKKNVMIFALFPLTRFFFLILIKIIWQYKILFRYKKV